jgi:nucleotide-binding universal stress UspA family protein
VKTLVCIDGRERALEAVRLAANLYRSEKDEATFLFVRRYRKETRGYNIRRKATETFRDWQKELPEATYLREAANFYDQHRGGHRGKVTEDISERVLIHLGEGVFEEGMVYRPPKGSTHLKIREGYPTDEIQKEAEEGQYDLVMLGARSIAGCRWYHIEHIPFEVARKASRPVMVVAARFEAGQTLLVWMAEMSLSETSQGLIQVIAKRMKSRIRAVALSRTADNTLGPPERVASIIEKWREGSLTVTFEILTEDPLAVIPEMAVHAGLVVCPSRRWMKRQRLDKLTKKILSSSQFNLLVVR